MVKGRIIKALSGFYYVQVNDTVYTCKAKGIFRKEKICPLVGDFVEIEQLNEHEGMVAKIIERKNYFIRPSVANVDQLVIVACGTIPETDPYLIDRLSSFANYKNCDVLIVINKIDLNDGKKLSDIYLSTELKCIKTSAITGNGIEEFKNAIRGKVNVLTGNSGAGKSSLLNALNSNLNVKVDEVSVALGRGKHTTRHTEMFLTESDTYIIDTPGFSSIDTSELSVSLRNNLDETFTEFRPFIHNCQFLDCKHLKEKGCSVIEAKNKQLINLSRYQSYVRLYNELKDLKEWNS